MGFRKRPVAFRELIAAAREIGADNLREMNRDDAAALVLATAMKTKGVDPNDPRIDWEGLIEFVKVIMPFILTIIDLF